MRLLVLALVLPAAIVLGIAAFETRIFYPPPSNAPAAGIVWHGRTFAARDDFARWLRSRGVRYTVWAGRHQAFLRSRRHTRAQYAAGSERVRQKGFDGNVGRLGVGLAAFAGLGLVAVFLRRRRPGGLGSARQTFRLAAGRAAPVARRGTGLMLRRAKATAVVSSNTAESLAKIASREGTEFARSFAHRAAPAAKRGAGLMLSLATSAALVSSSLAASSAKTISRRRSEYAWYLASALLAAGIGVVATVWLNGG
jgi:hypothetical protein